MSSFSGRQAELLHLTQLLTASTPQTACAAVLGPSGSGKTALVRQFVATGASSWFPDGAIWLDMGSIMRELVRAACRMGWPWRPEPTPEQACTFLRDTLSAMRALLVVDNVPKDPAPDTLMLLPILGGQSRTLFISQSAAPLQRLPIPVTSLVLNRWTSGDCISYLRALGPRCNSAPEADLVRLAERVDHLPLGVHLLGVGYELGASSRRDQLLNRLSTPPPGEAGTANTALAQAFLDVFDALGESPQRILLTLGACAKATHQTVIAEVSGIRDQDAMNSLEQLRHWSLVEFTEYRDGRFGLLDSIRLLVQQHPRYQQFEAAHLRWATEHARRFGAAEHFAEFARGADEVSAAIDRLLRENRHHEASTLGLPLYTHFKQGGRYAEAMATADRILSITPQTSITQAQWLSNLGTCHLTLGKVEQAIDAFERALAIYERLASSEGRAHQLGNLGLCYLTRGDTARGIEHLERSLAVYEELRDLPGQATQLGNLGLCHLAQRNIPTAIDFLERSVAVDRELGNLEGQATQFGNLGLCHLTLGNIVKAMDYHQNALAIEERLGRLQGQANQLANLGLCNQMLGHVSTAILLHQRSLAINENLASLEGQATNLGNLGLCRMALEDVQKANEDLARALALYERLGMAKDHPSVELLQRALEKYQ